MSDVAYAPLVFSLSADDCPQGWAPAPISVQNEICYKKLNDTSKYNNGAKLCLEEDPRATMAMPKTDQEIKAVATKWVFFMLLEYSFFKIK